ncbi:MAG: autorepressor SdpR family transcription factor [Ruthenibacterium sp.]
MWRGGCTAMLFEATFKALADPTRRRILELLRHGEMSAGELCARFDATGATISHHLSVLKAAGLVSDEKRGKYIYYSLDTSVVEDIFTWLAGLCAPGGARPRQCAAKPPSAPRGGRPPGCRRQWRARRPGPKQPGGKVGRTRRKVKIAEKPHGGAIFWHLQTPCRAN